MNPPITLGNRVLQSLSWLVFGGGQVAVVVPIVLLGVQVVGTYFAATDQPDRNSLDVLGYGLLAAGPLALLFRGVRPVLVPWLVCAVTFAYFLLDYPAGPVVLSAVYALFISGVEGYRAAAWLSAAALYVGHFGSRLVFGVGTEPTAGHMGTIAAWLLVLLASSEVIRARHLRTSNAAQAREEESRRRRSEERLQIARELHDVLAHNISLINVRSGVALHLIDKQPEQARPALTAIEAASREALAELRSVLEILRQPEERLPLSPAPGLNRIDSLVSNTRAAGIDVELSIDGEPHPVTSPVDAAAFRVVQEALTNIIRHSRARRASVSIRYCEQGLSVVVQDDGIGHDARPQTNGERPGKGIAGMRERVVALGGTFQAGPNSSGRGFRVEAHLPVRPEASTAKVT